MDYLWTLGPVALILGVVGTLLWQDLRQWLPARTLKTVTVHTTQDQTFEGLLAAVSPDGLVLRAAKFVGEHDQIPLSGETFIPKGQVSFVQVVK